VSNVADAFQGLINKASPAALVGALGVSLFLLLIATILLLAGMRKWVALGIGSVALVASMAVLLIIDLQTVTSRESASVTVTRPKHSERSRNLARSSLIALPALAVLVAATAWASTRRRLRRSVPRMIKTARMHLFAREYDSALAQFNRAIHIAPYLAEAYSGRGAVYQGLGDLERALADYSQAIQFDPRLATAFMQRAKIRADSGDLDGALADLSRVMDLHPTDPELYLNRGICFWKKGLLNDAALDFQRVLKLTNHSDFAEPAKTYLAQLAGHSPGAPPTSALPPPQSNGVLESPGMPGPKTRTT
jgi:tetratricopeptide (TPR) repeat protein